MRHLLTALVALTCSLTFGAEPWLAGWEEVSWDMTEAQIATAYPKAKRLQERATYGGFNGRSYHCDMILADVTVAGHQFKAHFLMDYGTNFLACVQLEQQYESLEKAESVFKAVQDYLVQKHSPHEGAEDLSDDGMVFAKGSKIVRWRDVSTWVDLRCLSMPLMPVTKQHTVSIAFQKPVKAGK